MVALNKRLSAFSLIEVLVAMIIVLIMTSFTTLTFINLSGFDRNQKRLDAMFIVGSILQESKKNNSFLNEDIKTSSIVIQKTVEDYNNISNLKLLKVSAYTLDNVKILEQVEIIRIPEIRTVNNEN
ncbi:MAG: hypothetical protein CVU05_08325 [Bacteroidetes bacterium HGW-Bacteroidetes-21]|jgi:prepilin-type N-terminal cleavage/methylation domain-containing protein|nr:MAG: hypothetical protein CVU05_08325 [Bacteroidetes bacterium HGW-Bacteroidetes-21]